MSLKVPPYKTGIAAAPIIVRTYTTATKPNNYAKNFLPSLNFTSISK